MSSVSAAWRNADQSTFAEASPGHRRAIQHRLRKRRQLDLLRVGPGGRFRARRDPAGFRHHRAIFLLTAATYAEATTMYPEAGGSRSFARRAFNEFWSFFAAWGQMLTYIITARSRRTSCRTTWACSGSRWARAARHRLRHRGRRGARRLLNIVGVEEAGGREHHPGRSPISDPGPARDPRLVPGLQRVDLSSTSRLRH